MLNMVYYYVHSAKLLVCLAAYTGQVYELYMLGIHSYACINPALILFNLHPHAQLISHC